jgi:Protein of unknown function (DUF2933)
MSDEIITKTDAIVMETLSSMQAEPKKTESACQMHHKGSVRGGVVMAVCCAAPLLILGAVALFGLSLGALASGLFTTAALLACPVGMFLMMRMMNKKEQGESRK